MPPGTSSQPSVVLKIPTHTRIDLARISAQLSRGVRTYVQRPHGAALVEHYHAAVVRHMARRFETSG